MIAAMIALPLNAFAVDTSHCDSRKTECHAIECIIIALANDKAAQTRLQANLKEISNAQMNRLHKAQKRTTDEYLERLKRPGARCNDIYSEWQQAFDAIY